jgi:MFS family permease
VQSAAKLPKMTLLAVANVPYAMCFDVLEVVLPALIVVYLHASPAWSAVIFVTNTVLVIALQLPLVMWLTRFSRRAALAGAGVVLAASYLGFWIAGVSGGTSGTVAITAVSVLYTFGEILYTGSGTALVTATAPPHLLGKALARWQVSTGLGQAAAPAVLTLLLSVGAGLLWSVLGASTLMAAGAIARWGPRDVGDDIRHRTSMNRA